MTRAKTKPAEDESWYPVNDNGRLIRSDNGEPIEVDEPTTDETANETEDDE